MLLRYILSSMRLKQWYKNFVIFLGLIFSLNLLNFNMWLNAILAFIIFCLLSGSAYIINDILDIKADQNHPIKSRRAIASGKLNKKFALAASIFLIVIGFIGAWYVNLLFLLMSMAYFVLSLLYSLFIKKFVIVDVLAISLGFVIRAIAGALAINVLISPWLVACTFIFALFLAFGKRKQDLFLLNKELERKTQALSMYSLVFLNQALSLSASTLIVLYSMYAFIFGDFFLLMTLPVIMYGILRYLFLVTKGTVNDALTDRKLWLNNVLWISIVIVLLYLIPK